ncbi:MAG: peptidoglycan DD-metalloendopeptidase family protein [Ruminococcus sp.]|nr:peptidoglycan DD-metalloendopeptidase family protein [Ruminococcus sp.]
METKFIGLDGLGEIENLRSYKRRETKNNQLNTTQKTLRFVKRVSKFALKSLLKNSKKLLNVSSVKISNANSVNSRRYSQNTSQTRYKTNTLIRKKALLAFAVFGLVGVFSFITVAGAVDIQSSSLQTANSADMSSPSYFNKYVDNYDINELGAVSTADEAFSDLNSNARTVITKALIEDNLQSACVGLYIDNQFIGATSDGQALNEALEQILVDYREGYDDETTTEFVNDVEIRNGKFDESKIKSVSEIIADAEGMFSIALATDIIYTREIAYDVTTEYDDSQPSSYEKVKVEGENGEEQVTVRTVYVDGVQTDAYVTDSTIIKEAVDEVVVKGGSSSDDSSSSSASSYGSGSFIWPLPYTHNLTSDFGSRWGRLHGGLDIASGGVYGQSIIAADSGTVILAGNQGDGYGNYVIIDHGNGYKTLYGHMSSVAVYAGQQVAQGEVIGYVGSTGNSTGPHLHFEIRVNDVQTDPLQFVS